MRHKEGESRHQGTFFPERLDDYIGESHPARIMDAWVDSLDMAALQFDKATAHHTGRPPYNPTDLLKLYLYGYFNQIRSSRQLERESHRNLELMWLLKRLRPDFRTIARFRSDNSAALIRTCQAFIAFCCGQEIFKGEIVAIDGSRFASAASPGRAMTAFQNRRDSQQIEQRMKQYLEELERNDKADEEAGIPDTAEIDVQATLEKLRRLKGKKQKLDDMLAEMEKSGQNQHVATDPDARLLKKGGHTVIGYNIQTAVEGQSKLIIHHDVTQDHNDKNQLYPMSKAARDRLGLSRLTVISDAGYFNAGQMQACEEEQIDPIMPDWKTANPAGDYYPHAAFVYDRQSNSYRCPAGETLHHVRRRHQENADLYVGKQCGSCFLREKCTPSSKRSLYRSVYADASERMNARREANPELLKTRKGIVEHPFANLKRMMGNGRFLLRGLEKVRAEMSLCVLSYNFKRVIRLMGGETMLERLKTA